MATLRAVAFDAIETCLSLEPLRPKLMGLGLKVSDLELWFSNALRDAMASEALGRFRPLKTFLLGALEVLVRSRGGSADPVKLQEVISTFAELPVHDDVAEAFQTLKELDLKIAIVTNGGAGSTRKAFERAGLLSQIDAIISADAVKHFKPSKHVYRALTRKLEVAPRQLAMVSAHGWDVHGANEAGLHTFFVARNERQVTPALSQPDDEGASLLEVMDAIGVRVRKEATLKRRTGRAVIAIGATVAAGALVRRAIRH